MASFRRGSSQPPPSQGTPKGRPGADGGGGLVERVRRAARYDAREEGPPAGPGPSGRATASSPAAAEDARVRRWPPRRDTPAYGGPAVEAPPNETRPYSTSPAHGSETAAAYRSAPLPGATVYRNVSSPDYREASIPPARIPPSSTGTELAMYIPPSAPPSDIPFRQAPLPAASLAPAPAVAPAASLAPAPPRHRVRPNVPKAEIRVIRQDAPEEVDERLYLLRDDAAAQAASFRVLRHRVVERGDPRSILVTSADDGEGKTTCAANLALALAESGRAQVLLLETNTRGPALTELFGIAPTECFLDQLARHRDRPGDPWSVIEIASTRIHVLAIVPTDEPRPLDGPAFTAAFDRLRGAYDYLVVDAPSVLGGADVNLIQDAVDGLVFAVAAGAARARTLKLALEQVSPADVSGLVLMDG